MAKLSDIPDAPTPDAEWDKPIDAQRFVQRLLAMELDPLYLFAFDTISGIRVTVELTGHVTAGQDRAIQNIRAGAQRAEDGRDERRNRGRYKRKWDR